MNFSALTGRRLRSGPPRQADPARVSARARPAPAHAQTAAAAWKPLAVAGVRVARRGPHRLTTPPSRLNRAVAPRPSHFAFPAHKQQPQRSQRPPRRCRRPPSSATTYHRRCCAHVRFLAVIASPPSAPPHAPSSYHHRQGEGANFGRPFFTAARRSSAPRGWAVSVAFLPFFRARQLRLVMLEL
jgi:hypothetical protein